MCTKFILQDFSFLSNGQGLVLFDNLYHGRTEHCDTFDNEPLCSVKDFECKVVEVICFK